MQKMAESYRIGTLSLQEAATVAKVSIYEMMDYVELHHIFPPPESVESLQTHFDYAQRILKK